MAGTVLDVALIRRLLDGRRPIEEIVQRTGASIDQIERVHRNFPPRKVSPPSKWGDRADELRRFHAAGKTSGEVAAHYGVTRNAIIGAWSRLGLHAKQCGRPRIIRTPEQYEALRQERLRKRAERERIKRAELRQKSETHPPLRRSQASILAELFAQPMGTPMPDEAPPHDVIPILTRDDRGKIIANPRLTETCCRWVIGDPRLPATGFCPNSKVSGLSYCEMHAAKAYAQPTVRRPRPAPAPKAERIPTFADAESD